LFSARPQRKSRILRDFAVSITMSQNFKLPSRRQGHGCRAGCRLLVANNDPSTDSAALGATWNNEVLASRPFLSSMLSIPNETAWSSRLARQTSPVAVLSLGHRCHCACSTVLLAAWRDRGTRARPPPLHLSLGQQRATGRADRRLSLRTIWHHLFDVLRLDIDADEVTSVGLVTAIRVVHQEDPSIGQLYPR